MIFKKKKENICPAKREYVFMQSKSYKGYKRVRLSAYGNEKVQNGLKEMHYDIPVESQIKIKVSKCSTGPCIDVFVNDHMIGVYYPDHKYYDEIRDGRITGAHVIIDSETNIGTGSLGRLKTYKNYFAYLFISIEDVGGEL